MVWRIASWILWAPLLAAGVAGQQGGIPEQPKGNLAPSAAYFLVIDHSGSMSNEARDEKGKSLSRWELMSRRADEFLRAAPLESSVWIYVFAGDADDAKVFSETQLTNASRAGLADGFARYARRNKPDGGTALYDTLARVLTEAEREADRHPGGVVQVMVYTDGKDEHSKTKRKDIEERWGKLYNAHSNTWLFMVPIEGATPPLSVSEQDHKLLGNFRMKSPRVLLSPDRIVGTNPAGGEVLAEVSVQAGDDLDALAGQPVRVRFEGSFEASVTPEEFPLRPGSVAFRIVPKDRGALSEDVQYEGRLVFEWPKDPQTQLLVTPPFVALTFQKSEKPKIAELYPRMGPDGMAHFPVDTPVRFSIRTLAGAEVTWDLRGDGTVVAQGTSVEYAYPSAGRNVVKVRVRDPSSGLETDAELQVDILDLFLGVNPLQERVFAGIPVRLESSHRGDLSAFQWIVDGTEIASSKAGGTELDWTFAEPGRHRVSIAARHPLRRVESEPLRIDVAEEPSLTLVAPKDGAVLPTGAPLTFEVSASLGVDEVVWTLEDAQGGAVLHSTKTQVGADPRVALIEHSFDEGGPEDVVVRVRGLLGVSGVPDPTVAATIHLRAPSRTIRITAPVAGKVLDAREDPHFVAETVGPGIEAVRWSARVGTARELEADGGRHLEEQAPIDKQGRASWNPHLGLSEDGVVEVRAETVLRAGLPASAKVSAKQDYELRYPEVDASLDLVSGGVRWNDPVTLRVDGEDVREVTWDFGDGSKPRTSTSNEITHDYGHHGTFQVTATVTGAGGKQARLEREVVIGYEAPKAALELRADGAPASTFAVGQTVEFADVSSGDIEVVSMKLDGKELAPSERSHLFGDGEQGRHRIELTVESPADRSGSTETDTVIHDFEVVVRDPIVASIVAFLVVLGLALATRFFLGNGPRRWEFLADHPFVPGAELADWRFEPIGGLWSRWRKRAFVPLDVQLQGKDIPSDRLEDGIVVTRDRDPDSSFALASYSPAATNTPQCGIRMQPIRSQQEMSWHVWDASVASLGENREWCFALRRALGRGGTPVLDLVYLVAAYLFGIALLYFVFAHFHLRF